MTSKRSSINAANGGDDDDNQQSMDMEVDDDEHVVDRSRSTEKMDVNDDAGAVDDGTQAFCHINNGGGLNIVQQQLATVAIASPTLEAKSREQDKDNACARDRYDDDGTGVAIGGGILIVNSDNQEASAGNGGGINGENHDYSASSGSGITVSGSIIHVVNNENVNGDLQGERPQLRSGLRGQETILQEKNHHGNEKGKAPSIDINVPCSNSLKTRKESQYEAGDKVEINDDVQRAVATGNGAATREVDNSSSNGIDATQEQQKRRKLWGPNDDDRYGFCFQAAIICRPCGVPIDNSNGFAEGLRIHEEHCPCRPQFESQEELEAHIQQVIDEVLPAFELELPDHVETLLSYPTRALFREHVESFLGPIDRFQCCSKCKTLHHPNDPSRSRVRKKASANRADEESEVVCCTEEDMEATLQHGRCPMHWFHSENYIPTILPLDWDPNDSKYYHDVIWTALQVELQRLRDESDACFLLLKGEITHIGTGGFKQVFMYRRRKKGGEYAVAVVDTSVAFGTFSESSKLSGLHRQKCEHIVEFIGDAGMRFPPPGSDFVVNVAPPKGLKTDVYARFRYIEMEYANEGDIHDFVDTKCNGDPLEPNVVRGLSFQILIGLHVLHSSWYIHNDLKNRNILLSRQAAEVERQYEVGSLAFEVSMPSAHPLVAKIADLGSAYVADPYSKETITYAHIPATVSYTPVNILIDGDAAPKGSSNDLFGFGICMFHLANGTGPHYKILSDKGVLCPEALRVAVTSIWKTHNAYSALRNRVEAYGPKAEQQYDQLCIALYFFLVLLPHPAERKGPVWKAVENILFDPSRIESAKFKQYRGEFNFKTGKDEAILKARAALTDDGVELVCALCDFNPKRRPTTGQVLQNSSYLNSLRRENLPDANDGVRKYRFDDPDLYKNKEEKGVGLDDGERTVANGNGAAKSSSKKVADGNQQQQRPGKFWGPKDDDRYGFCFQAAIICRPCGVPIDNSNGFAEGLRIHEEHCPCRPQFESKEELETHIQQVIDDVLPAFELELKQHVKWLLNCKTRALFRQRVESLLGPMGNFKCCSKCKTLIHPKCADEESEVACCTERDMEATLRRGRCPKYWVFHEDNIPIILPLDWDPNDSKYYHEVIWKALQDELQRLWDRADARFLEEKEEIAHLGAGGSKRVFMYRRTEPGGEVAVGVVDESVHVDKHIETSKLFWLEFQNCEHVVKIIGDASMRFPPPGSAGFHVNVAPPEFLEDVHIRFRYIEMEYANEGDIQQFVKSKCNGEPLEANVVRGLAFQLLMGLHALHEMHFIHNDLKTSNMLLFRQTSAVKRHYDVDSLAFELSMPSTHWLVAKIADLGNSYISNPASNSTRISSSAHIPGTTIYVPVNILFDGDAAPRGYSNDTFGLGIGMFHLATGVGSHYEILVEKRVVCPASLLGAVKRIWENHASYSILRKRQRVVCGEKTEGKFGLLCDALYYFLVLLPLPLPAHRKGPVWKAVHDILFDRSRKEFAAFKAHRAEFNIKTGKNPAMLNARVALTGDGVDLVCELCDYDPKQRPTTIEVLEKSDYFSALRTKK